jgi:hypothetical protein
MELTGRLHEVALFNPRDYLHTKAIAISQVTQNRPIVTSQMVLTEFLNHYSVLGQFFRQRAVLVVRNLQQDSTVVLCQVRNEG